jgi:hypothetical protein
LKSFLYIFVSLFLWTSTASADHSSLPLKKYRSPCKIQYPSDKNIHWKCRPLKKGETLETLFGEQWEDVARFNRIDRRHAYPGNFLKIPNHPLEIEDFSPMPEEYPLSRKEEKFILINLSEQFLGAYEYGVRVFSSPIASGEKNNGYETPIGEFRITAADRDHHSSLYAMEDTETPYPMNYALRFFISRTGVSYWIHGRDLPGFPASHGCIGLYDEAMQEEYYGLPENPQLDDAKRLYEWVLDDWDDSGQEIQVKVKDGPKVLITGQAP